MAATYREVFTAEARVAKMYAPPIVARGSNFVAAIRVYLQAFKSCASCRIYMHATTVVCTSIRVVCILLRGGQVVDFLKDIVARGHGEEGGGALTITPPMRHFDSVRLAMRSWRVRSCVGTFLCVRSTAKVEQPQPLCVIISSHYAD